jgi:hypothetical protein
MEVPLLDPAAIARERSREWRVCVVRKLALTLGIVVACWTGFLLVHWLHRPSLAPPPPVPPALLRAEASLQSEAWSVAGASKIFDKYPSARVTNRMFCTGYYCYEAPNRVYCKQLNDDVPESNPAALWECTGTTDEGYDLDTTDIRCDAGHAGDPRNGCFLYLTMRGPWHDWSTGGIVGYCVLVFLFVLCGGPVLLIVGASGAGGRTHTSRAFG